jgi:peroxiredoxin Q/BCP
MLHFPRKDDTPGCTTEGAEFRDRHGELRRADSLSLQPRLQGEDEIPVRTLFGVMKQKNMHGKKVRGIERSTFVIDHDGRLARAWRGVKVPGHVEEVLSFVKAL